MTALSPLRPLVGLSIVEDGDLLAENLSFWLALCAVFDRLADSLGVAIAACRGARPGATVFPRAAGDRSGTRAVTIN